MAKRLNLKGIELGRTIGIEVEGYTKDFQSITNTGVRHSILKRDSSLGNSYGWHVNYNRPVGLEVVSNPLSSLDMLDEMFEDIKSHKWYVGRGRASTHIHVDVSDYTLYDKIKMAVFMQKLDTTMFMLVKPTRYKRGRQRNQYCEPLDSSWSSFIEKCEALGLNINNFVNMTDLRFKMSELSIRRGQSIQLPHYNRYNFANVFNTRLPTIEFRLFHAIRESSDAKRFGLIAYHITETVKHSTIEQLNFIADSINQSQSAEDMVKNFSTSIGLEFTPKIFNPALRDSINIRKSREMVAV